jgi:hypothetical protein
MLPYQAAGTLVVRKLSPRQVVCVAWQQVGIGRYYAGQRRDVHVDGELLRLWSEKTSTSTDSEQGLE